MQAVGSQFGRRIMIGQPFAVCPDVRRERARGYGALAPGRALEKRPEAFFENRSKNVWYFGARAAATRASDRKVFWFFFQKRTSSLLPVIASAGEDVTRGRINTYAGRR
jgi:hypothetical protein